MGPVSRALLGSPVVCALLGRRRAAPDQGRTLDSQCAALLALASLDPGLEISRFPPPAARARMAAQIAFAEAPPPPGVAAEDLHAPGPAGDIPVRLYVPPGLSRPSAAVIYFHGGGMVAGSVDTHDTLCRRLAVSAGVRVASVDYRLAPEHRFPAAIEDALAAYRWLAGRAAELGADPARLAVAGDSAGGNLAAVVALHTRGDAAPPALQVLVYPATDLTRSLPSHRTFAEGYFLTRRSTTYYLDHYIDEADRRHPDASPLFAPDLGGAARALVYTAGFDPLRDEGLAYADRLKEASVWTRYQELPGLLHGFANMTGLIDAARYAMSEVFADIARELRA
jgi:acetyl esterase